MKEEMEFNILLEEHASSDCKECLIKAYNLGAREDAEFWVEFFREWKSVEFDKEQRIVIEHSLEVAQKRLRELE